jgi:hypothetical protein
LDEDQDRIRSYESMPTVHHTAKSCCVIEQSTKYLRLPICFKHKNSFMEGIALLKNGCGSWGLRTSVPIAKIAGAFGADISGRPLQQRLQMRLGQETAEHEKRSASPPMKTFLALLYESCCAIPLQDFLSPPSPIPSKPLDLVSFESVGAMAAPARALRPLKSQLALSLHAQLRALPSGARFLATSQRRNPIRPGSGSKATQIGLQFWRSYADAVVPKKPKRFRTLRWIWRLTYLSIFGGLAWVGYGIYQDRHPEPQTEPDPNKKTLVILGMSPYNFETN